MPNEKSKGNIVTRFSDMEKSGKRTEWICSHGIGHHQGIHGCDGCCVDEPEMEKTTKDDFQRESIPSKNPMEECGHGLDEICDICDMTPNIKKELSECCGAEKIPLIDGKRVEVDNCIECGKPFFSSKNPMEEKRACQCQQFTQNGVCEHLKQSHQHPQEEEKSSLKNIDYNVGSYEKVVESQQDDEWEDTLREIIYSNWKKGDEVGLFVAVRSLIEARVQEAYQAREKAMLEKVLVEIEDMEITGDQISVPIAVKMRDDIKKIIIQRNNLCKKH